MNEATGAELLLAATPNVSWMQCSSLPYRCLMLHIHMLLQSLYRVRLSMLLWHARNIKAAPCWFWALQRVSAMQRSLQRTTERRQACVLCSWCCTRSLTRQQQPNPSRTSMHGAFSTQHTATPPEEPMRSGLLQQALRCTHVHGRHRKDPELLRPGCLAPLQWPAARCQPRRAAFPAYPSAWDTFPAAPRGTTWCKAAMGYNAVVPRHYCCLGMI